MWVIKIISNLQDFSKISNWFNVHPVTFSDSWRMFSYDQYDHSRHIPQLFHLLWEYSAIIGVTITVMFHILFIFLGNIQLWSVWPLPSCSTAFSSSWRMFSYDLYHRYHHVPQLFHLLGECLAMICITVIIMFHSFFIFLENVQLWSVWPLPSCSTAFSSSWRMFSYDRYDHYHHVPQLFHLLGECLAMICITVIIMFHSFFIFLENVQLWSVSPLPSCSTAFSASCSCMIGMTVTVMLHRYITFFGNVQLYRLVPEYF